MPICEKCGEEKPGRGFTLHVKSCTGNNTIPDNRIKDLKKIKSNEDKNSLPHNTIEDFVQLEENSLPDNRIDGLKKQEQIEVSEHKKVDGEIENTIPLNTIKDFIKFPNDLIKCVERAKIENKKSSIPDNRIEDFINNYSNDDKNTTPDNTINESEKIDKNRLPDNTNDDEMEDLELEDFFDLEIFDMESDKNIQPVIEIEEVHIPIVKTEEMKEEFIKPELKIPTEFDERAKELIQDVKFLKAEMQLVKSYVRVLKEELFDPELGKLKDEIEELKSSNANIESLRCEAEELKKLNFNSDIEKLRKELEELKKPNSDIKKLRTGRFVSKRAGASEAPI